ncbi:AAA domain-containing protein [bacterium]|nr:AAA domain-containing protein [bacterium]
MASDDMKQCVSITEALHIHGWTHLDAIFLASLTMQAPTLLIGLHGTAKTFLVEQVAASLNLIYRHYNASLLNYDDLVGIPMPDEDGTHLRFITTAGAIWQAEFVFFDEISRCRPDLQNKLFPIIHERRVVGMDLPCLQHRWAAMNPPASDTAEMDSVQSYLGSEPLDTALTDRFAFIIPVPAWRDLSRKERLQVILGDDMPSSTALDLADLMLQCHALIPTIEAASRPWLGDYLMCTLDLLDKAKLSQSPRRARILARNLIAIHAARIVLEGEQVDLETSAEIALLYSIPQNATDTPPQTTTLITIHRQAWEVINHLDNETWRQILEEPDVVRRVLIAEELGVTDEEMGRLVTGVLSANLPAPRKVGLAVAMFLAFSTRRTLPALAWEPLIKLARPVLTPSLSQYNTLPSHELAQWNNEIRPWVCGVREGADEATQVKINFILSGFPNLWRQHKWQDALSQFSQDLQDFQFRVES